MQAAVEGQYGKPFAGRGQDPRRAHRGQERHRPAGRRVASRTAWFIGFAPANAPRIAMAVIVEQGGRGGQVAAPIGGQLMGDWLKLAP